MRALLFSTLTRKSAKLVHGRTCSGHPRAASRRSVLPAMRVDARARPARERLSVGPV